MKESNLFYPWAVFFLFLLIPGILFSADPKKPPDKTGAAIPALVILRPDLVVDRIWLDARCAVNFTIRNAGPGVIDESEHARGMVRVLIGKDQKDYPFKVVDSGNELKKPGKSVSFNTQAVLENPAPVKVTVDADGGIPETHEGNNSRQEYLTPGCKKEAALGLTLRAAPVANSPEAGPKATQPMLGSTQRPPAAAGTTVDLNRMPMPAKGPLYKTPPSRKETYPIDVFEPRAGALLHPGGEINVRWVLSPEIPADVSRPTVFNIGINDNGGGGVIRQLSESRGPAITLTLPEDLAAGDNYVIIVSAIPAGGNMFYGRSRPFRIGRANGIVLVHPPEHSPTTSNLTTGHPYTIEWNCTGTFADPVDVKVLTADGVNRDNLALRIPCSDRRLSWVVGRGWTGLHSADGLYRIRVESSRDRNNKAESAIFRINPPVFALGSPTRGAPWPRYSRQTISWTGGDGVTPLRIALFKGGEHYSDIARNLHPSFRSLNWLVSYGYTDYATLGGGLSGAPLATGTMGGVVLPLGNDYQIKISQEGLISAYTLSDIFSITE